METIPKVKKHELLSMDIYGTIYNSRIECKCKECMDIKQRRDRIYKNRKCLFARLVKCFITNV